MTSNRVFDVNSSSAQWTDGGALSHFVEDFDFARTVNWDGAGAIALSSSVIRATDRLIQKYAGIRFLSEVAPGRDGSLSIVWDDLRGNYAYMDVGPNDTIHLFWQSVSGQQWEGVSLISDPQIEAQLAASLGFVRPASIARTDLPIIIPSTASEARIYAAAA